MLLVASLIFPATLTLTLALTLPLSSWRLACSSRLFFCCSTVGCSRPRAIHSYISPIFILSVYLCTYLPIYIYRHLSPLFSSGLTPIIIPIYSSLLCFSPFFPPSLFPFPPSPATLCSFLSGLPRYPLHAVTFLSYV